MKAFRNRFAHWAVNRKVGGLSPPRSVLIFFSILIVFLSELDLV